MYSEHKNIMDLTLKLNVAKYGSLKSSETIAQLYLFILFLITTSSSQY